MERTLQFQEAARRISCDAFIESLEAAKKGDMSGQLQVAATMTWAAYSCPDAIPAVFDNIGSVWLGEGEPCEIDPGLAEAPIDDEFWSAYWAIVGDYPTGVIPSMANAQITSLGISMDRAEFGVIAERFMARHPRVGALLAKPIPEDLNPELLRSCPYGSLGHTVYRMMVGHGYSQELVDQRTREMSGLEDSLRRVHIRMLQMYRPWQLVGGYEMGDAHDVAFGGFQISQFGLIHQAMVQASFATIICFLSPTAFFILMYLMAEGWQHGQSQPDFMAIDWEYEWIHSIDAIRRRHGITPFRSVFSKDLFSALGASRQ